MEERKEKEIEYYDKEAEIIGEGEIKEAGSLEGFNPFLLASYRFLVKVVKKRCQQKRILDYGCGMGLHLSWLSKVASQVIGIDLSKKSLEVAKKRLEKEKINNAKTILMDCEKMDFRDDSFDVVFDGGTFSSLDLRKAMPEISRVLKPDGFLIGIETFGHNPLTNLKRKINKLTGKRTEWAASHIFKIEDLKLAERYFKKRETYFFHLVSCLVFPFLNLPGGKLLLKLFEKIDHILLSIFPFLKKYSFKLVFVFSEPKKYAEKNI